MRARVMAAVVGLALLVGGVLVLGISVISLSSGAVSSDCSGEDCLNDLSFLGMPLGIIGIVFGLIIGGWALGSIREERGAAGPLAAFGFMSGLGAVFVTLGAIFLFAPNTPDGGGDGTFLFLGGLFGLMGLSFAGVDLVRFRGALKRDRLRLSGLHGTARVMAVRDSNVTINNSPMVNLDLEVTVPGRPAFRTRKRIVVSRLSVGALVPGATIPVLADPATPTDVLLDWDGEPESSGDPTRPGAAATESGAAALAGYHVDSGLPARVNLDSIQDTGVDIAGSRLYAFDLTVSVAGREPYVTNHAAVVPVALVPRLVRGASFPAQVDPSQPGQIVVRWDR